MKILRQPAVSERTGRPKSTTYSDVTKGTLTRPVKVGPRAAGWPEHEIDAIVRARIAGRTEGEIRALVSELHSQRGAA